LDVLDQSKHGSKSWCLGFDDEKAATPNRYLDHWPLCGGLGVWRTVAEFLSVIPVASTAAGQQSF
jgi:hypothetical protein